MREIKISRLVRSRRRTIELTVTEDARLVVRAPLRTPLRSIEGLVKKKREWISRKMLEIARLSPPAPKQFKNGEVFLLLGKGYELRIAAASGPGPAVRLDGFLLLSPDVLTRAREEVTKWYKGQALEIFRWRCDFYSGFFGFSPLSVRVSSAEKRWGSCGAGGRLNFTWKLVMAPQRMIDYIVVHEMAHIAVRGHSEAFWELVADVMPDYRERRKWLKDNGHLLTF